MGSGRVENQACCPYTAGSMRARLVPSRRLALAFVAVLGAILGVVLFSESARVPLRTPFVPRSARGEPTTIALEGRGGARGSILFRADARGHRPPRARRGGAAALPLEPDAAGRNRLRGAAGSGLGVRIHRKRAGRDRNRPAHRLPPRTRLLASGDAAPRDRARPRRRGEGLRRSRPAGLRASRGCGPGNGPGAVARGEDGRRSTCAAHSSATRRRPHGSSFSTTCGASLPGSPGSRGRCAPPSAWPSRAAWRSRRVRSGARRILPPPPRSCAPGGAPPSSPRASRCSTPSSRRRCPVPTSRITCSDTPISRRTARSRKTPWRGWQRPTSGASATTPKSAFAPSTSGSRSSSSTPSCAPPRSPSAARCSHGSSGPWRRS